MRYRIPGWSRRRASDDERAANKCRALLESSLVDFFLERSIDRDHGGYLQDHDDHGDFVPGEKFVTLQARQLWFFSALANVGIRQNESLAAAGSGFEFLRDHFRDEVHGGYFSTTTREGEPIDRRKHAYHNAFVIYGLVEHHRATGQAQPLELAIELFDVLDSHGHDDLHGGYHEFFQADWQPIDDPEKWAYLAPAGTKTFNAHLHLLEAFAQLYRETANREVAARLTELLQINTTTVQHSEHRCNIDNWNSDWTPIDTPEDQRVSYGHDIECAWLVLDATEALGRPVEPLVSWAIAMCESAIEHGYDGHYGGFYRSGEPGHRSDDRAKDRWPQAEGLIMCLTLYELTGDTAYRKKFDQTLAFIARRHVCEHGGWYRTVDRKGSPIDATRAGMWLGAYHSGRALLRCEAMLRGVTPR